MFDYYFPNLKKSHEFHLFKKLYEKILNPTPALLQSYFFEFIDLDKSKQIKIY